ncbi:hypothetical protein M378DRAFT_670744 [Amanita muscaria Koide BX008]|uniref:Uncharacterized protein n=1 Tax=Amanita muscaria (strain Koide BX008) TaxID=946122 RepID=A0A0C2X3X7_AMAMK|nr:hypothetical protein M378DRAFT_670744 [Amanita muscaria Koide BX008]
MCCIRDSKTLVFFTANILLMDNGLLANFARFAVAISDVLVVHSRCLAFERYCNDLTPLLRSIFIAHLQLFGQLRKGALAIMGRTLLLLIGHDPNPLLSQMETICSVHYTQVWQGIKSNPEGRAGFRQLVDYFDVDVVTVPEETRTQKIYQLRSQFTDSDNRGYLFKPGHHKHVIPGKFALSMEDLWHQLKATRSLGPREQEVVVSDLRSWIKSGVKTILESPDDGLEDSLLSLLLNQLRRADMRSGAPTAECIDILFVLLGMKNYVHIILQIEAESDAELLLDLFLVVLDNRVLLSIKPNVPDAHRRVRRLMFKLATKIPPVIPPSLRISKMRVIHKYAGRGGGLQTYSWANISECQSR